MTSVFFRRRLLSPLFAMASHDRPWPMEESLVLTEVPGGGTAVRIPRRGLIARLLERDPRFPDIGFPSRGTCSRPRRTAGLTPTAILKGEGRAPPTPGPGKGLLGRGHALVDPGPGASRRRARGGRGRKPRVERDRLLVSFVCRLCCGNLGPGAGVSAPIL